MLPETLQVYTDGACLGNPGPGGWAWICVNGDLDSGYELETTNQRMELTAALKAISHFTGKMEVYSDSAYLINCFANKWYIQWQKNNWMNANREPVKNADLWKELIYLVTESKDRLVIFKKVKAHSGEKYNELVDTLARKQANIAKNLIANF